MTPQDYHRYMQAVADEDVLFTQFKDISYNGSWMRRGGVGAFMMLARKWDRLEELVGRRPRTETPDESVPVGDAWDIFEHIDQQHARQGEDGTVLAEVRDLRRYLLLVEARCIAAGSVRAPRSAANIMKSDMLSDHAVDGVEPAVVQDGARYLIDGKEVTREEFERHSQEILADRYMFEGRPVSRDEYEKLQREKEADSSPAQQSQQDEDWLRHGSASERRVPRHPEPDYPGTPDDGGHHESRYSIDGKEVTKEEYERYMYGESIPFTEEEERHPINLTNTEWEALGLRTIEHGSMRGTLWQHMYERIQMDGRWLMVDMQREEYGR